MLIPSPRVQEKTLARLKEYARRKRYVGKKGVTEIRGWFKGNHLFLEVVKEAKGGFVGKLFNMGSVKGIGKVARLEYMGPNKWKFLIYRSDTKKYGPYREFSEGTIEQCLDVVAKAFLS